MTRKFKIFDYPWHIPHQYDMINALKDHCEFYFCLNTKKTWDERQRPIPDNVSFVTFYEDGIYDVAILHIDQSIILPDNIKTRVFNHFDERINDIPKIIINHGTPVFPEGVRSLKYDFKNELEAEKKCVSIIKSIVRDRTMVVNSHRAALKEEWGFGVPIVHGIDVNDWYDVPNKEPRAFTALSPRGFDTYYNRSCMFGVYDELFDNYGYTLSYAKLNIDTDKSVEDYKTYLGKSLIYVDTSFRTPMNRARTEAFLSGCCVVQVEGAHDLERWAIDGENIILVPDDHKVIARTISDIIENRYQEALEIGKKGKEMAMHFFNPQRYKHDWLNLLNQILIPNT